MRNDKPNDKPATPEFVFGAPGAPGAFRAAHHFSIHNSTLNDVQGNYVRDHFVVPYSHC